MWGWAEKMSTLEKPKSTPASFRQEEIGEKLPIYLSQRENTWKRKLSRLHMEWKTLSRLSAPQGIKLSKLSGLAKWMMSHPVDKVSLSCVLP